MDRVCDVATTLLMRHWKADRLRRLSTHLNSRYGNNIDGEYGEYGNEEDNYFL